MKCGLDEMRERTEPQGQIEPSAPFLFGRLSLGTGVGGGIRRQQLTSNYSDTLRRRLGEVLHMRGLPAEPLGVVGCRVEVL